MIVIRDGLAIYAATTANICTHIRSAPYSSRARNDKTEGTSDTQISDDTWVRPSEATFVTFLPQPLIMIRMSPVPYPEG